MAAFLPYCTENSLSKILNRYSDNGGLFLVPDFMGKAFDLSPLGVMLPVGFHRLPLVG